MNRTFRYRSAVAAGLLAAVTSSCATFGSANYVSIEEEWQLGRELEADLARRLPLVDDATLERYVNDVGQRMVRQTNMANLPWRFHVVRDGEVNAFNVPGGLVYVHTGLLAKSGSAAEFAGALAHSTTSWPSTRRRTSSAPPGWPLPSGAAAPSRPRARRACSAARTGSKS
jgi:hypothetical protein